MHPLRPLIQKFNGRVMNNYIRTELNKRFNELKQDKLSNTQSSDSKATKSVMTIAIECFIKEKQQSPEKLELDEHFAQYAVYQIRLFPFAGNDTTSSTIVYEMLQKLREEHDAIFGTDPSQAAQILKEKLALLNKCTFTLEIIKETLRLYPPAATMRAGQQGVAINDRHGNIYPMDYIGATILHQRFIATLAYGLL